MRRTTLQQHYLPEFIYGSIDGLVTTFAIVAGVMGGELPPVIILVLGFASVLADGFSMGSSKYLSQKSENKVEGVVQTGKHPLKAGLVTFVSFVIIGSTPLISFVLAPLVGWDTQLAFKISIGLTVIMFVIVGYVEGAISNTSKVTSSIQTLVVGALAALIAYYVGDFISTLV